MLFAYISLITFFLWMLFLMDFTALSLKAGTLLEVPEYSLGSTGVLLRKYRSTLLEVLEYSLESTGVLPKKY